MDTIVCHTACLKRFSIQNTDSKIRKNSINIFLAKCCTGNYKVLQNATYYLNIILIATESLPSKCKIILIRNCKTTLKLGKCIIQKDFLPICYKCHQWQIRRFVNHQGLNSQNILGQF